MKLHILDVESIYRRLLNRTNVQEREAMYRQELLAPFEGMMRIMGGGDPVEQAKMWTLYTPEDFDGEQRPIIEEMVRRLTDDGAWQRFAAALERGVAAFAASASRIGLDTIHCAVVLTKHTSTLPGRGYAGFGGIPGYHVVQHYLQRTGRTAVEATFLPSREIIAESGFFE